MSGNNKQKRTKGRKNTGLSPATSPMPLEQTFVVQFRDCPRSGSAWFAGRTEHVMSGQSGDFVAPEELIEFFGRVMNQQVPPRGKGERRK